MLVGSARVSTNDQNLDLQNAGLFAVRVRGRKERRPKGVMDPNKQKEALALQNDTSRSISEICEISGVCRNTYYKYVRTEESTKSTKRKKPPSQAGPASPAL